jgi:hypothetical protein
VSCSIFHGKKESDLDQSIFALRTSLDDLSDLEKNVAFRPDEHYEMSQECYDTWLDPRAPAIDKSTCNLRLRAQIETPLQVVQNTGPVLTISVPENALIDSKSDEVMYDAERPPRLLGVVLNPNNTIYAFVTLNYGQLVGKRVCVCLFIFFCDWLGLLKNVHYKEFTPTGRQLNYLSRYAINKASEQRIVENYTFNPDLDLETYLMAQIPLLLKSNMVRDTERVCCAPSPCLTFDYRNNFAHCGLNLYFINVYIYLQDTTSYSGTLVLDLSAGGVQYLKAQTFAMRSNVTFDRFPEQLPEISSPELPAVESDLTIQTPGESLQNRLPLRFEIPDYVKDEDMTSLDIIFQLSLREQKDSIGKDPTANKQTVSLNGKRYLAFDADNTLADIRAFLAVIFFLLFSRVFFRFNGFDLLHCLLDVFFRRNTRIYHRN